MRYIRTCAAGIKQRRMKEMSEKLRVGILGGTGMVGQRFISLLENHPVV